MRLVQERALQNQVEQGFAMAAALWTKEEITEFNKLSTRKEYGATEAQIATELTPENQFAVNLQNRYQMRGKALFGLKRFEKPNKENINSDYALLMGGNIERFMDNFIPKDLPAEERAAIINNKEFQTQAANQLLYWRARNGGLSRMDVDVLINTPWGKDAINAALENNKEAQRIYEELQENGLAKGDFAQWLAKQGNKNAFTILMGLLLGVGGLTLTGVIGAPLLAAGAGISAAGGLGAIARKNIPDYTQEAA